MSTAAAVAVPGVPAAEVVTIALEPSYPIYIGPGLLDDARCWQGLPASGVAAVVTNTTVAPLYAQRLLQALRSSFAHSFLVELPDGEQHKNWQTLQTIFDRLLQAGCDRSTVLFALGGGVVGDMGGFAASCYMRGIAFVQVPTTLLAQVDSAVGGKTAINHPLGKNMIGAFYQPRRVVADLSTLDTLPRRELVAGLAEVIKYGPIADEDFFAWIELHLDELLGRDKRALAHAVKRSCEIKAGFVGRDERESGPRAILNFGHTFGHAIEAALGYGRWLHGEAVGCGMVMAADLSARLGLIDRERAERVQRLVARAGLPVQAGGVDAVRLLELMRSDKKAHAGEVRFIVLDGPGHATVCTAADALVVEVIEAHRAR